MGRLKWVYAMSSTQTLTSSLSTLSNHSQTIKQLTFKSANYIEVHVLLLLKIFYSKSIQNCFNFNVTERIH